jgi:hypothetical protein
MAAVPDAKAEVLKAITFIPILMEKKRKNGRRMKRDVGEMRKGNKER